MNLQERLRDFGSFDDLNRAKEEYRRLYLAFYIWMSLCEEDYKAAEAFRELRDLAELEDEVFSSYIAKIIDSNNCKITYIDENLDKLNTLGMYLLYGDASLDEALSKQLRLKAIKHSTNIIKEYGLYGL